MTGDNKKMKDIYLDNDCTYYPANHEWQFQTTGINFPSGDRMLIFVCVCGKIKKVKQLDDKTIHK